MPVDSLVGTPIEQIAEIFGITLEAIALVAGLVFFATEASKGTWPKFFKGRVTVAAAFLVSFGLSVKIYYPHWEQIIVLAVVSVIVPMGGHKLIKRLFGGSNS
jgi:predicted Kef-type K+ transport protein